MAHSHTDPPTQPLYAPPQQSWWGRLNPLPRAIVIIGGALGVVIFGCCGPLMVLGVLPGAGPPSEGDRTEQAAPTPSAYLSTTDPAAHEQVSIPSTLPAPLTTDVPATTPAPPTTTTRTTTRTTTSKPSTKTTTKTTTKTSTATCHSSYADVCVPVNVEDVDCDGGSGDGPYYVKGPVRVVGPDVYRLDNDGDGIACEN